ncbi:LysM domain-containing protein [Plantibacter flavus]|uniref:LysM domain-containing protein n=1 Tax=Plantibacter flavus TaxID=150123 RepID=A0A3N2BLV8_9MICO|nr:LysM peptidoglycan-binding domain-containing protein [Plantibacter flavus]ROR76024.1 LysM domain-containing protein [Plantibacter flavus]SMG49228.1 LysM domain-containing protein [Plantibacter flavus]
MIAGGASAAVLLGVLLVGGLGAANTMSAIADARAAQAVPTMSVSPTPDTDDSVTPPDRDSDQNPVPEPVDEIYVIQEGDTLTDLSARFGMSIDYIANYNAVRDVNVISEGAVLRVPFIYIPPAPDPASADATPAFG